MPAGTYIRMLTYADVCGRMLTYPEYQDLRHFFPKNKKKSHSAGGDQEAQRMSGRLTDDDLHKRISGRLSSNLADVLSILQVWSLYAIVYAPNGPSSTRWRGLTLTGD